MAFLGRPREHFVGGQSMRVGHSPTPPAQASVSKQLLGLPTSSAGPALLGAGCFLPPQTASSPGLRPLCPGLVGKCWWQLTLERPALTREIVVHLVTFSFFPRVLASFSPHVQGRISGLGGELSQLLVLGKERGGQGGDVRPGCSLLFPGALVEGEWNQCWEWSWGAPAQGQDYLNSDMIFGCSLRNPTHHAEETRTQPLGPKSPLWCGLWPKWPTSSSGACSSLPVLPGVEKERCTHREGSRIWFFL